MGKKNKKSIGIHEAYANDPIKADLEIFGREVEPTTRRGFLKKFTFSNGCNSWFKHTICKQYARRINTGFVGKF